MSTSRFEMYASLGLLPVIAPATKRAIEQRNREEWAKDSDFAHGHPWHTSFHASQFPDPGRACPRLLLYTMMDIPKAEPPSPFLSAVADAGKDIELRFIAHWAWMKILRSTDQNVEGVEAIQSGWMDRESWLTCSSDAIVQPYRWNRPVPIEVKTKAQDKIDAMKRKERGPDEKHIRQLKVQTAFLHLHSKEEFPDLEPCMGGVILYISRDDPSQFVEFYYPLDLTFFEAGRQLLIEWRGFFERGELPPHPFGGKEWSKPPCQYCDFKKFVCKPDHEAGITRLEDSNGIGFAKSIRPEYDYNEKRRAVLERWKERDGTRAQVEEEQQHEEGQHEQEQEAA